MKSPLDYVFNWLSFGCLTLILTGIALFVLAAFFVSIIT